MNIHQTTGAKDFLSPETGDRRWTPVEVTTKRVGQRAQRREIQPSCEVREDGKVVSGLSTAVRPTGTGRAPLSARDHMLRMLAPTRTPEFRYAGTTHHSIEGDYSGLERRVAGMLPELAAPYGVMDEAHVSAPTDPHSYQRAFVELISEGYLVGYGIYHDGAWWAQCELNRTCLVCGAPESQSCGC